MKKIISFLVILLLCIAVIPAIFSEENQTNESLDDDNETDDDLNETDDEEDDTDLNETDDDLNETDDDLNETDDDVDHNETNETDDDDTEDESDDEESDEDETDEEDESEDDADEEEQVGAMVSPPGAQVRLLQLEKAITKSILAGNEIIAYISETNQSIDVSELNAILDSMEVLIDEIHALPTNGTGADLASQFVDIKDRAKDLIKQFREKARAILKETDRSALRERIKNLDKEVIRELNERIRQARIAYNAWKVQSMLEHLGITDEELIAKIKSGEISFDDLKKRIREHYHDLTKERRKAAAEKLKEEINEKREQHKVAVDALKARMDNLKEKSGSREGRRLTHAVVKKTLDDREKRLEQRARTAAKTGMMTDVNDERKDMMDDDTAERGE